VAPLKPWRSKPRNSMKKVSHDNAQVRRPAHSRRASLNTDGASGRLAMVFTRTLLTQPFRRQAKGDGS
jgi:hypothetical protein